MQPYPAVQSSPRRDCMPKDNLTALLQEPCGAEQTYRFALRP